MLGFARRTDGMGCVEQCFGGDATTVEANPAQSWIALDENDFLAQVGRVKRRGVSARPCADDNDFCFDWVHEMEIRF